MGDLMLKRPLPVTWHYDQIFFFSASSFSSSSLSSFSFLCSSSSSFFFLFLHSLGHLDFFLPTSSTSNQPVPTKPSWEKCVFSHGHSSTVLSSKQPGSSLCTQTIQAYPLHHTFLCFITQSTFQIYLPFQTLVSPSNPAVWKEHIYSPSRGFKSVCYDGETPQLQTVLFGKHTILAVHITTTYSETLLCSASQGSVCLGLVCTMWAEVKCVGILIHCRLRQSRTQIKLFLFPLVFRCLALIWWDCIWFLCALGINRLWPTKHATSQDKQMTANTSAPIEEVNWSSKVAALIPSRELQGQRDPSGHTLHTRL